MIPKISIIIPCYKVERYLRECLGSVQQQTFKNWEAIVINDASPENEESVIREFTSQDTRFKYIKNPVNMGLGLSRTVGQNAARGQYIMFLDADDFIMPKLFEKIASAIEKYNAPDIIEFPFYLMQDGKMTRANWLPNKKRTCRIDLKKHWCLYASCVWCRAFRRKMLDTHNIKTLNIRTGEDVPFTVPAFCMAKSYVYLSYPGYAWRQVDSSLSHTKRDYNRQLQIFNDMAQNLKSELVRLGVYDKTFWDMACINIMSWYPYDSGRKWYNFVRKRYKKYKYPYETFVKYNCPHLHWIYHKITHRPYWMVWIKKHLKN